MVEAVALEGRRLLVSFCEGPSRVYAPGELRGMGAGAERALSSEEAFASVEAAPGGRGVQWGSSAYVSDHELHQAGEAIPVTWSDLAAIAPALLVDAAEAAGILDCTRQNVNALVKRNVLRAAKASSKATLFLRADVRSRRDEDSHAAGRR